MSNVIDFKTRDGIVGDGVQLDPNDVLEAAKCADLDDVVVIGTDKDGGFYLGGSGGARDVLWLMECGKAWLMDQALGE